jgi:hypothetical protein
MKKSRSKRSAPKVCQSWQAIERAKVNYFIENKIYKTYSNEILLILNESISALSVISFCKNCFLVSESGCTCLL